MITCPNCTCDNIDGAVICDLCGENLQPREISDDTVFELTPKGIVMLYFMDKLELSGDASMDYAEEMLEKIRIYAGKIDRNAMIFHDGAWFFEKVEKLTES